MPLPSIYDYYFLNNVQTDTMQKGYMDNHAALFA